jgi:hypothetical protein
MWDEVVCECMYLYSTASSLLRLAWLPAVAWLVAVFAVAWLVAVSTAFLTGTLAYDAFLAGSILSKMLFLEGPPPEHPTAEQGARMFDHDGYLRSVRNLWISISVVWLSQVHFGVHVLADLDDKHFLTSTCLTLEASQQKKSLSCG